jgi:hypothetical protein
MTDEDVDTGMKFLVETGMVSFVERSRGTYALTEKGFSVAHDRVVREDQLAEEQTRAERQHDVNRAVAFLTLGLMTVTVFDSAVRLAVGFNRLLTGAVITLIGMGFVGTFALALNRLGLLSAYSGEK